MVKKYVCTDDTDERSGWFKFGQLESVHHPWKGWVLHHQVAAGIEGGMPGQLPTVLTGEGIDDWKRE